MIPASSIPISRPSMSDGEVEAVASVLRSGVLTGGPGPCVSRFQDAAAGYMGVKHAVAVSSGTAALCVALESLGIGPGDEVITTPFTFIATSNAILFRGATPVFADIDPLSYNIDPASIEEKITDRAKAILPVHLYGRPCDMDALAKLCRREKLIMLEDCAQSMGAAWKGKKTGSFGSASILSFYATKNLCTGEGGMVLTDSDAVRERAFLLSNQGRRQGGGYEHLSVGFNYRMTEMQAALGLSRLPGLDSMNRKRAENARFFNERFQKLGFAVTPAEAEKSVHAFHQYTLRVLNGRRDALAAHLEKKGVETRVYYPEVNYLQPAYKHLSVRKGSCPEAEKAAAEVLSIPVHPSLSRDELERIADAVVSFNAGR